MCATSLRAALLAVAVGLVVGAFAAHAQDEKKDDKDKGKDKDKKAPGKDKDKKAPAQPKRPTRTALLVLPVKEQPDAEALAALEKVFGKDLEVTPDKDLNVVILRGPDKVARAALVALRKHADVAAIKRAFAASQPRPTEEEIELVKLRRADAAAVAAAVKKHVGGKVEGTEKAKSRALVFEGEREAVNQAVSLAKQLDGQQLDYEVQRLLSEK